MLDRDIVDLRRVAGVDCRLLAQNGQLGSLLEALIIMTHNRA